MSTGSNPLQHAQIYTDFAGLGQLRAGTPEQDEKALRELAGQFESIFIGIALKSMRSANEVFAQDSPFNSQESKLYRDMLDNQLSLTLAQGRGVGLADTIFKQLSPYLRTQSASATATVDTRV